MTKKFMSTDIIVLPADKWNELELWSYSGYSYKDMAINFGCNVEEFVREAQNENSKLYYHIRRGILKHEGETFMKLAEYARNGNITAISELEKIRRDKSFETSKLDIFGGFDSVEVLDKISAFLTDSKGVELSPNEAMYMELLAIIVSIDKRFGKRGAVKFLTSERFGFKHSKASDLYNEAINMFYSDRGISKDILREKYAEQLDNAALVVLNTAKSPKDFAVYKDLIKEVANLRKLNELDEISEIGNNYLPIIRLFSVDAKFLGISVNRTEVAKFIDNCEQIPKLDKQMYKQQAMAEDINFQMILEHAQEKSTV